MDAEAIPQRPGKLGMYILKVAARCNINCTYCYEFNLADTSWKKRPPAMSDATFATTLERIRRHCAATGQTSVTISFHGGEPLLVGTERFARWCDLARETLAGIAVHLTVQTNATLIDDDWAKLFLAKRVSLGISLDGPPEVHDRFRVDHRGKGTYEASRRGIEAVRRAGHSFGILSVIQPGADALAIHRHFLTLGCESINYLMPEYTHDQIAPIRAEHGPTPCADFLLPIFDEWWHNGTLDVKVRLFWEMAWMIMGGSSQVDCLGNRPLNYVVVQSDGAVQGLDVLKACEDGMTATGLNVHDHDFAELDRSGAKLHADMVFRGLPLPTACRACPERDTCGGGYQPHRFARATGFDNPSVWCADLLKLFGHIRERLAVSPEETIVRRRELQKGRAAG